MRLVNKEYNIEINRDSTYTVDSADNKHYDIIFNPFKLKHNDNYSAYEIQIKNRIEITSCILIGYEPTYCSNCAILDENILTVLIRDELIQIDVKQKKVIGTIHINSLWPVLYEIRKYVDGYIIFGELDVIKLNYNFELEWDFSAPDIIIGHLLQDNNEILITDWNNDRYRLNSLGKQI